MGHTNSTTNYALPQFITTDKPAWLTDINGAFLAIDTGMDAAKDAADNAQSDATQALTDAGNAATAAAAADAKGAGAVASIADAFDPTTVYSVGDYVVYNSLLYRCSVAVVTPGPWTGSANWERKTLEEIIPFSSAALPYEPGSVDSTKDVLDAKATVDFEYFSATIGGESIPFWFRAIGPIVVVNIGGNSTAFPTTWTVAGYLPSGFRPNVDRYVTIVTIDGNRINVWVDTSGVVRIYASTGTAFTPTGSAVYVMT